MHGQGHRREQEEALRAYSNKNQAATSKPRGKPTESRQPAPNMHSGKANQAVPRGPATSTKPSHRTRAQSPSAFGTVRFMPDGKRIEIPPKGQGRPQSSNTAPSMPAPRKSVSFQEGTVSPPLRKDPPSGPSNMATTGAQRANKPSATRVKYKDPALSEQDSQSPSLSNTTDGPGLVEIKEKEVKQFLAAVEAGSLGDSILDFSPGTFQANADVYRIILKAQEHASTSSTLPDCDYYVDHPDYSVVFFAARKALLNKAFSLAKLNPEDRPKQLPPYDNFKQLLNDATRALKDAKYCTADLREVYALSHKEDILNQAIDMITESSDISPAKDDTGGDNESSLMAPATTSDSAGPPDPSAMRLRVIIREDGRSYSPDPVVVPGVTGEISISILTPAAETPAHLFDINTYILALRQVADALTGNSSVNSSHAYAVPELEQDVQCDDCSDTASTDSSL